MEIEGDFKAVISLGQSLLAILSKVCLGLLAMLQRRYDAIRYGCYGGCNKDGVHKGLIFMVIVMLSNHSALFYILFSSFMSWWSSLWLFGCGRTPSDG